MSKPDLLVVLPDLDWRIKPMQGEIVHINKKETTTVNSCLGYRPGGFFVIEDCHGKELLVRPSGPKSWTEYGAMS